MLDLRYQVTKARAKRDNFYKLRTPQVCRVLVVYEVLMQT